MSGLSIKQRIALELQRQLILDNAEKHPLRQLFWESTLRCNMKCRHCGSDCKVSSLHPDMPFEDFAKVLRRIKEKRKGQSPCEFLGGLSEFLSR